MDRFSRGLPDPQDTEYEELSCTACGCDIAAGDSIWNCDGDICCSADCAARYMGAEEGTAGEA